MQVALQLNNTHPAMADADIASTWEGLEWEAAWDITTRCCAYINHTILPEALERWPVRMLAELQSHSLEIIFHINHLHMEAVLASDKPR